MKKIITILMVVVIIAVVLVPCAAYKLDNYTFNGGAYNDTMYADGINISYCNVEGTFFAGDTLTLGVLNDEQYNLPSLCSYTVPTTLGRNVFGDFVPFSLNGVEFGLSYNASVPADQTEVSYSMTPNMITDYNDVMQVEYEIPNAHSLYFVGSFGHHFGDYAEDFSISFTAGSARVWQSGTYYILNHIEDGESPHLFTVPVNRAWAVSGNSVAFAPTMASFDLPNEVFDWYFVGSILVQPSSTNTNPDFLFSPRVSYRMIPDYEYSVHRGYYDNYEVTYNGEYHNFAEKFFTSYISQYTNEVHGALIENVTENGTYVYNVSDVETIQVTVNVPQEVVSIEESNMFSWLTGAAEAFLQFEIAPDFTIGSILLFVLGFGILIWILKIFLGG